MDEVKYFFTYETHVKLRWKGKALIDVLANEFKNRSREYYEGAIAKGVVTVNNKIVSPTHRLKDLDIIRHTVHNHEPRCPEIEVIEKNDNFWVVNKPAGIPCHPTGGYFEYSVTRSLFGDKSVGCVNRLDMPVSGVLIITINNSDAAHTSLKTAEKVYIAKVQGEFPEFAEVDQPIGLVKVGMYDVDSKGKPSKTTFKKLYSKDGFSIVECRPLTGRTHQIRIHLKYLGFPIVNDIMYGGFQESAPVELPIDECNEDISQFDDKDKYEFIKNNCKGKCNRSFELKSSYICLHAIKYKFQDTEYEAKAPSWALW